LVLCDLAEEGKLSGPVLPCNGDLASRFSGYFRVAAARRGSRPEVRLPFFHLRSEGVWKPLEHDGRVAEDRHRTVAADLDASFLQCLQDPEFRTSARRALIARYFPPAERAELYPLVGLPVPDDDAVAQDAARFQPGKETEAKRDAKFAIRVLPAYDYTCALTRCRMIALDGTTPLDAAHIHQFKRGGSNDPTNGIARRGLGLHYPETLALGYCRRCMTTSPT
jgi:putative restriction endonuclease